MSKSVSEKITVTLLNRDFTVACKTEEKTALLKAVAILNKRLRDLRNQGSGTVNFERLLVVVALNLCNESLQPENQVQLPLLNNSELPDRSNTLDQTAQEKALNASTLTRLIEKIDTALHSAEK